MESHDDLHEHDAHRRDFDRDVREGDRPHVAARHGIISAIFHDGDDAESAYREVRDRGYAPEEVTVLMSEQARNDFFPSENVVLEREHKTLEGTGAGGAIGAAVGAVAGALAAIGTTILIPGLGIVVAGPLAAALAGAGAGGVTGGVIGALVGAGMTEERARVYQTAIEEGGVVLSVNPRTSADAEWIEKTWNDCGAEDVYRNA